MIYATMTLECLQNKKGLQKSKRSTLANMKGDLRILVFKGDPHTVDGERVLLVLVPVVMPGDVALHCGDVRDVLHTRKEPGGHKGELS